MSEKNGCEDHLYRGMSCCLHPCLVQDCPEPICAMEFPGGVKAYLRSKELREILESAPDINKAAEQMGVTAQTMQRRYNRIKGA